MTYIIKINLIKKIYSSLPKVVYIKSSKKKQKIIFQRKQSILILIRNKLNSILKSVSKFKLEIPHLPKRKKIVIPRQFKLIFIKIKYFIFGALIVTVLTLIFQLHAFLQTIPNPTSLNIQPAPMTTKIYDRNDNLLYEIYAEENRTPVKLSDIPKNVKNATIAIEDKNFYSHNGFSFRGIIRAIVHNLTTDSLEGGSTITQQLIRSALLTPERTIKRKVQEIVLSVWAEQLYTKDQILEMYLNQVPYGGTAWGIEAASQTYFGKSVKDLTLAESALLAGLPAAPSRFSPFGAHPELSKMRQEETLKRMVNEGYITREEEEEAKNESLHFKTPRVAIAAPHFVMYIKDQLEQLYGLKLVETGGLRVKTTLDLSVQEMAQKVVSENIESLRYLSVGNGAALITNPQTGEILAMVGSADYFDREHQGNVNVTLSLRQPGSSIKVVNYAAALGQGFTAATILEDTPITYVSSGQTPYSPVNYDGRYHGRVTLRVALASSYNIPAVKILAKIGVKNMIEQGKLMGITSWNNENFYGLSLTLGGGEVTMLDMAKVYGTLANGGVRQDLTPFIKITNYKGETFPLPSKNDGIRALSKEISFILSSILSDNSARSPAFGSNSALVIPEKTVAVKTGTSDNKRDNWTIGYTPEYVTTVWVGNNNSAPMNPQLTSGVTGAAPIWQQIMTNLLKNKPDKTFIPPEEIVTLRCYGRTEYFVSGTQPKGGCPTLSPPTPIPTKP